SCPAPAAVARDQWRTSSVVPAPAPTYPRVASRPPGFPGVRERAFHSSQFAPSPFAPSPFAPWLAEIRVTGRRAGLASDGRFPSTGTTLPSPPLRLSVSPAQSVSWERDSG